MMYLFVVEFIHLRRKRNDTNENDYEQTKDV